MRPTNLRALPGALVLFLLVGCTGQDALVPRPTAAPSPTIAAALPPAPARPTPTIAAIGGRATTMPAIEVAPAAPAAEPSIYLWPTYLPPNMRPSSTESRVASEGQTGAAGLGFYVVTLNDGQRKLSIGGGDLSEVLPLSGDQRPITAGTRSGTLITSGDRREIVFSVARGKLFIYSAGLAEEELLKVAASLQPIDVKALRELAGRT